jgi:hypothetical protein
MPTRVTERAEVDLFEDIPGERPIPSNLDDPPPAFYLDLWNDPHVERFYYADGTKGIQCNWCGGNYRTGVGFNITKFGFHVRKEPRNGIKICRFSIPLDWAKTYNLTQRMKDKVKAAKVKACLSGAGCWGGNQLQMCKGSALPSVSSQR